MGITVADAYEFINNFNKAFGLDVSDFKTIEYFEDEGTDILGPIIRLVTRRKKIQKKLLKLGYLEKAIAVFR